MTSWPSPERLWEAVAETLEADILPALSGPTHATALQLSGLARYAAARGSDPRPARAAVLAGHMSLSPPVTWAEAAACASDLLVADRQASDDSQRHPLADAIRRDLRDFLEEDLLTAGPLLETFARHGSSSVSEQSSRPDEVDALRSWFSATLGQTVESFDVRVISGGHSRRMLDVAVGTATSASRFVVRVEQGGVFATEGASEAEVMRSLGSAGFPVAPVRWVEPDRSVLGWPFFVMERVEGEHDADLRALSGFAAQLDRLHRLDVEILSSCFPERPGAPEVGVRMAIDRWERAYRSASAARVPLLDDAAEWLRSHLTPTGPLCVVHGDPGPGNFIHRRGEVAAVTDWEFAHIGDAAEDWVYLATLRGVRVMGEDAWKSWLRDEVGVDFEPEVFKAWTAFNLFKGACANLTAAAVFESGASSGPNLLAIGTALHSRMLLRLSELIEG
ncbi:MAG: phosphotransferase family protein [Acidimicrobiales bacterium]